ncbi:MAG TPA: Arm DNA-binding domain-containing protein [Sphingobium sp.]|uniref:Arm DNA-binding domain-containing protein n=1 Tax=Sphingobium sp. TaxID=1912891 RepID=UPI002ECFFDA2
MSRQVLNRLSATKVAAIKEPGRHADGGGLYLEVDESRRSWIFRYSLNGRRCAMGIGSARALSLAKAREQAAFFRTCVAEGKNPKTERDRLERNVMFGDYADEFVETMSEAWRNPKHIAQWKMTLTVYAAPLRKMKLDEMIEGLARRRSTSLTA